MATTTFHDYNGDGSDLEFDYTFPTIKKEAVKIEVSNVLVDNWHFKSGYATSGTRTIKFDNGDGNGDNSSGTVNTNVCESSGAPKAGTNNVRIYRDTDVDDRRITYTAGSAVKAGDLNNQTDQLLYALQEEQNQTVTTSRIKDGAVTSAKIEDGTIVAADIANDAIDSQHYAADSIDSEHYAAGSVDGTAIANDAVDSQHYAADSIDAEHYAPGSVDGTAIANDAIDSQHYAASSIDTEHIGDNQVDGNKLADNIDIAGTLDVTGAATLDSTLNVTGTTTAAAINASGAVGVDGNFDVNTNKLTVDSATGNTGIAGTLNVSGTTTLVGTDINGAVDISGRTDIGNLILDGNEIQTASGGLTLDSNSGTTTVDDNLTITGNVTATNFIADEDDFTSNSATKVPTQQSTKAYITATSQPLNAKLTTLGGMESGTASKLAGNELTATTDELNILDGKSVVTTISSPTDTQLPTAQAVDERIIDLVTDVGGFRPIANETSFPATNPDPEDNAGTIVSVKALASNLTSNGSGVATIANGAGSGNTVTINGMANSDTIEAGKGILVETTTTLHTYTFHRETLAPADITNAKTAVDDFNDRYRILASGTNINTVGSLDDGDLLWDSNVDKMKVYDATASAWKEVTSTGDFKFLVPVNPGTTTAADWGNTGLSNGNSGTSWDLKEGTNSGSTASVTSVYQLLVSVNGVIQKSNTGSWSGSGEGFYLQDSDTIRFATAPAAGSNVFIIQIGSAISIPTPGDDTVSTVKIQNLAVSTGKIADQAVDLTKLPHGDGSSNGKFLRSNNGADPTWETVNTDSDKIEKFDSKVEVTDTDGNAAGKISAYIDNVEQVRIDGVVSVADGYPVRLGNLAGDYTSSISFIGSGSSAHKISSGSQDLVIEAGGVNNNTNTFHNLAKFIHSPGAGTTATKVELYASNVKRLETSTTGVTVTGTLAATALTGDGSALTGVAATSANGTMYKNSLIISDDHTIASTEGAHSVGPITVNATVTVNGNWVIS